MQFRVQGYGRGLRAGFRVEVLLKLENVLQVRAVTLYCLEILFCRLGVASRKLSRVAPSGYNMILGYGCGFTVFDLWLRTRMGCLEYLVRLLVNVGLFRFSFICVPVESGLRRI